MKEIMILRKAFLLGLTFFFLANCSPEPEPELEKEHIYITACKKFLEKVVVSPGSLQYPSIIFYEVTRLARITYDSNNSLGVLLRGEIVCKYKTDQKRDDPNNFKFKSVTLNGNTLDEGLVGAYGSLISTEMMIERINNGDKR